MKRYFKLIFCFLCLVFSTTSFAQRLPADKPNPCTVSNMNKGKYKILYVSPGSELQFYLEIKRQYRSDENYIRIAKEFKEKYCHESQLRVIYFASKRQWKIREAKNLDSTPLAIFYTGKVTNEKEGIEVYTIINGKVETRELDLTK